MDQTYSSAVTEGIVVNEAQQGSGGQTNSSSILEQL